MESCGYRCLRHLYAMKSKEHLLNTDTLAMYRSLPALSLWDLQEIVVLAGGKAQAYGIKDVNHISERTQWTLPCIAHLSFFGYEHYIVVLKSGWLVTYLEPGRKGRRFLPKFIFSLIFTKKIFRVECF